MSGFAGSVARPCAFPKACGIPSALTHPELLRFPRSLFQCRREVINMNGKQKCRILKQIRQQIAEANDIELVVSECTHKGDCRGTCPRCEAEVRYLERELEKRRRLMKRVALAGISQRDAGAVRLLGSGADHRRPALAAQAHGGSRGAVRRCAHAAGADRGDLRHRRRGSPVRQSRGRGGGLTCRPSR